MKRCMLILAAICVGFTTFSARSMAAPMPADGHAAWANGRGQDDDRGRGRDKRDKRDRHDRGRHEGQYRFDDHHREEARDWYERHRDDRAWRYRGEWRPEYDSELQAGFVLTPDFRRECRPLPPGLRREFGPPPRGFRYYVLGPHVVLVDPGYRVADVIHFDINIGH